MERLTNSNIHNITLSYNSTILISYYQNIINQKYTTLFLDNKTDNNSDYYKLQVSIYKILDSIYSKLKSTFRGPESFIDLNNYRKIISSHSIEYTKIVSRVYYKHFSDNKYISKEIKDYIIKTDTKYNSFIIKYAFNYEKIIVNIHFIIYINAETTCDNNIIITYDKYVIHMLALLSLVIKLTNNACSKNGLDIYIFKTPFERKLDNKLNHQTIGAKNINGGFSYGCTNKGNIIIYRNEEFFKVFSHELCHTFGIDKYIFTFIENSLYKNPESELYKKFINNFNLSKKINKDNYDIGIQESLVEFWAIFFNTSLFVFNSNQSYNIIYHNKVKRYIEFFDQLFNYEIVHTFFQTQKILQYNNITIDSILSTTDILKNKFTNYKETTHVFSYIILKLFLLINYREFINSNISLKRTNRIDPAQYKVEFRYSLKNVSRFFDYIISITKSNSDYIKTNLTYVKNILKKIDLTNTDLTKINNDNRFIKNNMRMSGIEIL
tara:strand:- start:1716 stop:3197 length:1482 start_codon:yes stop_codon:yes gene_type:complete